MNPIKKRLGKVQFHFEYVVDLDNKDMIHRAMELLYDDLQVIFKHDEEYNCIEVIEDDSLTDNMIPDYLLDNQLN